MWTCPRLVVEWTRPFTWSPWRAMVVGRVSAIPEPLMGLDIAMFSQRSRIALLAKRSTSAKPTAWPLYTQLIRVRTGSAIRTDADPTTTNEETRPFTIVVTITSWIPRRRWRSSSLTVRIWETSRRSSAYMSRMALRSSSRRFVTCNLVRQFSIN